MCGIGSIGSAIIYTDMYINVNCMPDHIEIKAQAYFCVKCSILHILSTIFMEVKGVGMGDVVDSFIDVGYRFLFQVINMYMMH